jgi:hypothetical protein
MSGKPFDYDRMIEEAMRGVARTALIEAAEHGLPGEHHFYISFRTDADGVEIPAQLHAQYPEEMSIVIQHQFWDLFVDEEGFSVTVAFGGKRRHLHIPFDALTGFVDPHVNFGLQFGKTAPEGLTAPEEHGALPGPSGAAPPAGEATAQDANDEKPARPEEVSDKVVPIDRFRKK